MHGVVLLIFILAAAIWTGGNVALANTAHLEDQCHEIKNIRSKRGEEIHVVECNNDINVYYRLTITKSGEPVKQVSSFWRPSISPDHRYVAYRTDNLFSIFDTLSNRVISVVKLMAADTIWYSDFIWSPDNSKIAFTAAYRNQIHGGRLLILNVLTGRVIKVSADVFSLCGASCYSTTPFWSPDGRYLGTLEPHWGEEEGRQGRFVIRLAKTAKQVGSYPLPLLDKINAPSLEEYGWDPDGKNLYLVIPPIEKTAKANPMKIPLHGFFKK